MRIAEITRAETARRAEQVPVRSHDVTRDFAPGEEVFGSAGVISFDAEETDSGERSPRFRTRPSLSGTSG
jgi:hypothetical protein